MFDSDAYKTEQEATGQYRLYEESWADLHRNRRSIARTLHVLDHPGEGELQGSDMQVIYNVMKVVVAMLDHRTMETNYIKNRRVQRGGR